MNVIITAIIALAIALGAPVQPASQPSQPASQPSLEQPCYEDMPCWDAATMGNLQGDTMHPSEVAAWIAIEDIPLVPSVDNQRPVYAATLDHLPEPDSLPLGYFMVADDAPNVFHMFEWVTFYDA